MRLGIRVNKIFPGAPSAVAELRRPLRIQNKQPSAPRRQAGPVDRRRKIFPKKWEKLLDFYRSASRRPLYPIDFVYVMPRRSAVNGDLWRLPMGKTRITRKKSVTETYAVTPLDRP